MRKFMTFQFNQKENLTIFFYITIGNHEYNTLSKKMFTPTLKETIDFIHTF